MTVKTNSAVAVPSTEVQMKEDGSYADAALSFIAALISASNSCLADSCTYIQALRLSAVSSLLVMPMPDIADILEAQAWFFNWTCPVLNSRNKSKNCPRRLTAVEATCWLRFSRHIGRLSTESRERLG